MKPLLVLALAVACGAVAQIAQFDSPSYVAPVAALLCDPNGCNNSGTAIIHINSTELQPGGRWLYIEAGAVGWGQLCVDESGHAVWCTDKYTKHAPPQQPVEGKPDELVPTANASSLVFWCIKTTKKITKTWADDWCPSGSIPVTPVILPTEATVTINKPRFVPAKEWDGPDTHAANTCPPQNEDGTQPPCTAIYIKEKTHHVSCEDKTRAVIVAEDGKHWCMAMHE